MSRRCNETLSLSFHCAVAECKHKLAVMPILPVVFVFLGLFQRSGLRQTHRLAFYFRGWLYMKMILFI